MWCACQYHSTRHCRSYLFSGPVQGYTRPRIFSPPLVSHLSRQKRKLKIGDTPYANGTCHRSQETRPLAELSLNIYFRPFMGKKRFERDKKYEGWLLAHLDMDLRERGLETDCFLTNPVALLPRKAKPS